MAHEHGFLDFDTLFSRGISINTDINKPNSSACFRENDQSTELRAIRVADIRILITCCGFTLIVATVIVLVEIIHKRRSKIRKIIKKVFKLLHRLFVAILMALAQAILWTKSMIISMTSKILN